jgi:UDP-glucose 4-epimerase
MNILIVGGAGYIGSHMAKILVRSGYSVTVLDNLSTGYAESVTYGKLVVGDIADPALLDELFGCEQFDAVMHFAANSLVGESILSPAKYYRNNVVNTLNLLDALVAHQVKNLVFSSSAAIFGEPQYIPIDESHIQSPINPYGNSKMMVEKMLADYSSAYGLNFTSLRYFNACGADPEGELGENHQPETHLIPLILQAASGRRESITVYGKDYGTDDGTCIRDYIHIHDLCDAHLLALQKMLNGTLINAQYFNLGNGDGFSVGQVIHEARAIVEKQGYSIAIVEGDRRQGDPAVLVADSSLAKNVLGWQTKYPDLKSIIEHAWAWELRLVTL